MVKIALCGKIRSGKDTVADYLDNHRGFERFKFSEGIWETLRVVWNINPDTPNKPRKMLQDVGQKLREVDEDVWINYTLRKAKEYAMNGHDIVITDLRQPNEYNRLREEGFIIVRVSAPEEIRIQRARAQNDSFALNDLNHETETHVDTFEVDYEIVNDGYLSDLRNSVNEMMAEISAGNGVKKR